MRASSRTGSWTVSGTRPRGGRSEEHTSELQSQSNLVCRLLLEKKKKEQDIEYEHYAQQLHTPAQFVCTRHAVNTLVGVSTGLAPEFNYIEVATLYAHNVQDIDV